MGCNCGGRGRRGGSEFPPPAGLGAPRSGADGGPVQTERPAGLLDPARNAPRKVPLTGGLGGETRWGGR